MDRKMRVLMLCSLVVCFFAIFAQRGTASAASISSPQKTISSADVAALQKNCAVLGIHLNGAQHTITCLHTHLPQVNTASQKGSLAAPSTLSRVDCNNSIYNFIIYNYNYQGALCFYGDGYLGVAIYQVNEIDNNRGVPMWLRYYNPSGVFCTIDALNYAYWGSNTQVTITQLDDNATHGANCPK